MLEVTCLELSALIDEQILWEYLPNSEHSKEHLNILSQLILISNYQALTFKIFLLFGCKTMTIGCEAKLNWSCMMRCCWAKLTLCDRYECCIVWYLLAFIDILGDNLYSTAGGPTIGDILLFHCGYLFQILCSERFLHISTGQMLYTVLWN